MHARLAELIAKWRADAAAEQRVSFCADDLDALLASEAQVLPEVLAQRFHEAYERLAPSFGYETRESSRKPWTDVPEQNKRLMIAVCAEVFVGVLPAPKDNLREWLTEFVLRERGLRDAQGKGGQHVGRSPTISPSVLLELECMLRDSRSALPAQAPRGWHESHAVDDTGYQCCVCHVARRGRWAFGAPGTDHTGKPKERSDD